ncbi:hypothetical protein AgCh_017281 [Apium graveolens]
MEAFNYHVIHDRPSWFRIELNLFVSARAVDEVQHLMFMSNLGSLSTTKPYQGWTIHNNTFQAFNKGFPKGQGRGRDPVVRVLGRLPEPWETVPYVPKDLRSGVGIKARGKLARSSKEKDEI